MEKQPSEAAEGVDFLTELPAELGEIIITTLAKRSPQPEKALCQSCLVSRAWDERISYSSVWGMLGNRRGLLGTPGNEIYTKRAYSTLRSTFDKLEERLVESVLIAHSEDLTLHDVDLMCFADGILVLGSYEHRSNLFLFDVNNVKSEVLDPQYPPGHELKAFTLKEGVLAVQTTRSTTRSTTQGSEDTPDAQTRLWSLPSLTLKSVVSYPRPAMVDLAEMMDACQDGQRVHHCDAFSIKHDLLVAICPCEDGGAQISVTVAVYRASTGELRFKFSDTSTTLLSVRLAVNPTGSADCFFVVWQTLTSVELRKVLTAEQKVVGTRSIRCPEFGAQDQMAVRGGCVHLFAEGIYPSYTPRDSNDSGPGEEADWGEEEEEGDGVVPVRGRLCHLCFDTTPERLSRCLAAPSLRLAYKQSGYQGDSRLHLVGCGSMFHVLAHTYPPPQTPVTDVYKIYRLPQLCPATGTYDARHPVLVGELVQDHTDYVPWVDTLGDTDWLDGMDMSNRPELFLIKLEDSNAGVCSVYTYRMNPVSTVS